MRRRELLPLKQFVYVVQHLKRTTVNLSVNLDKWWTKQNVQSQANFWGCLFCMFSSFKWGCKTTLPNSFILECKILRQTRVALEQILWKDLKVDNHENCTNTRKHWRLTKVSASRKTHFENCVNLQQCSFVKVIPRSGRVNNARFTLSRLSRTFTSATTSNTSESCCLQGKGTVNSNCKHISLSGRLDLSWKGHLAAFTVNTTFPHEFPLLSLGKTLWTTKRTTRWTFRAGFF